MRDQLDNSFVKRDVSELSLLKRLQRLTLRKTQQRDEGSVKSNGSSSSLHSHRLSTHQSDASIDSDDDRYHDLGSVSARRRDSAASSTSNASGVTSSHSSAVAPPRPSQPPSRRYVNAQPRRRCRRDSTIFNEYISDGLLDLFKFLMPQ
jgi:hypothetical protein